jgi:hypothetical protein
LVAAGTLWPSEAAITLSGAQLSHLRAPSTPQAAVENLLDNIRRHDWRRAYNSLANKSEFTQQDFINDLTGTHGSLRTYAGLSKFDVRPQHETADEAQVRAILHWSSVVGGFDDIRNLQVKREEDRWQVAWPIAREAKVPPQVIPVNYLRWDVIYRGATDDWGAQDVESPHVRIVDMRPVDRGDGMIIFGEILNEDVVPAYVEVKATLLRKDGTAINTEDSFDSISHILLPKQVSPFRINFRGVKLAQVDSVRMQPSSNIIATSADPVVEIEDQKLQPAPDASLTGNLVNQSGQVANIAHVLGTFYDNTGQVIWVSDGYANRALTPQNPVPFAIAIPPDIASKVSSYRVITSTYSADRFQ